MPKRRTSRYATSAPVSSVIVARRYASSGSSPDGPWRNEPVMRRWTTSVLPALQAPEEVLPAPVDARDGLADEHVGDESRLDRPRQPRVADLDALDRRALEHRREPAPDGLDLG